MLYLQLFVLGLTLTCFVFMVIGLFRPWAMLWWEDVQTRMKVINSYGLLTLVFGLVYAAMKIFYVE